ncbi:hypothetical protein SAMD00019534_057930, partial [Acytostelium subglobosum LB1]|uniref:hypothetical protein n=1 Tax=Acytostelium subglobosum LB1 TaxID=1410327 RepID=UPI0006449A55
MEKDIQKILATCDLCQMHGGTTITSKQIQQTPIITTHTRGRIQIDVTYIEVDAENYQYIVTFLNCYTKYGWAVATKNRDADSIMEAYLSIPDFKHDIKGCINRTSSNNNCPAAPDGDHEESGEDTHQPHSVSGGDQEESDPSSEEDDVEATPDFPIDGILFAMTEQLQHQEAKQTIRFRW